MYDADGSGSIGADELGELIKDITGSPMEPYELEQAIHQMDKDGGGIITWTEFKEWFFADDNGEEEDDGDAPSAAAEKYTPDDAADGEGEHSEVLKAAAAAEAAEKAKLAKATDKPPRRSKIASSWHPTAFLLTNTLLSFSPCSVLW